jgi:hypothetical protein
VRPLRALAAWGSRRWGTAGVTALAVVLVIGLPTDLVPNPVFGREIPPTAWAWPSLVVTAVLSGLLVATYVDQPADPSPDRSVAARRGGWAGGLLTFFAVGCPVCNKLVLLALGSAGALRWFEPVQPLLQLGAVALLAGALWVRLRGDVSCRVPRSRGEIHA